ncbi:hypothetical protein HanXRQr2_Chr04g0160401 [Helianthus annuus]|uniref:Uncharacterized protein n=1 Tax=Helianthus annuus TaxID=4232 RepID=A0A9K3J7D2_HELAN|nr:hypothetical protein HanXRQr2_Chr04g0160401 [Helianthus annuus]KAJ0930867.1 hypothetical protein HanPSC8_Chr04g0154511 [Helianthus annuus]
MQDCQNGRGDQVICKQEDSCKELEAHELILVDVNRHLVEAEARATKTKEERDDLATMNANLVVDRTWMRNFGVINIVNTILDAPENTDTVADVVARAREARCKAGYTGCLAQVNVVSVKKFTDEWGALRGVDTEATLSAATEAYDGLIVPALAQIEECLGADDYVDCLRTLFEPKGNVEGEGGAGA